MSSKASKVWTDYTHIYEETNEWDETSGRFAIYWASFWNEFYGVSVEVGIFKISFMPKKSIELKLDEIQMFDSDSEGFLISPKFGTEAYKTIDELTNETFKEYLL